MSLSTVSSAMPSDGQIWRYGYSKKRLFLFTAIGLLLPLTVWAAVSYARSGKWTDAAVLGLSSVPLAVLDLWVWRRLLSDRPALILTRDAMIEQASLFAAGQVSRAEIAGVRVDRQGFFKVVVVELQTPAKKGRRHEIRFLSAFLAQPAEVLAHDIHEWLRQGRPRF